MPREERLQLVQAKFDAALRAKERPIMIRLLLTVEGAYPGIEPSFIQAYTKEMGKEMGRQVGAVELATSAIFRMHQYMINISVSSV